jgi:hypothetical protein
LSSPEFAAEDAAEQAQAAVNAASDDGGGRWTVYAVSDLHTDMKANMTWVRGLPHYPPRTAIIVVGGCTRCIEFTPIVA